MSSSTANDPGRAVGHATEIEQLGPDSPCSENRQARFDHDEDRFAVSVIIPTYDRPQYALDAVRSVIAQRDIDSPGFEVIVVENNPQPKLESQIGKLSAATSVPLRHVHEARPGLHEARHRGATEARGDVLAYVDDDVLAPPDWLRALIEPFSDSAVAIVGGPVHPNWEATPPTWLDQFPGSYLSLLDNGDDVCDLTYPDGAYGCNLAVRRTVLFEVGGFNPDSMGWDRKQFWLRGDGETGLHLRVAEAGYRTTYQPSAALEHRIPAERLTLRAFRQRGLMIGLSHSFADLRADSEGPGRPVRRVIRALKTSAQGVRIALSAGVRHEQRPYLMSQIWQRYGYVRQHLLAIVSPRARRFIERESYWDDRSP